MLNSANGADGADGAVGAVGATIHCCAMEVRDKKNTNNGLTQLFKRNYNEKPDNTFEKDIVDVSDCAEFVAKMNISNLVFDTYNISDFKVAGGFVAGYCTCILWNEKLVTINTSSFDEFNPTNNTRKYRCYLGTGDVGFIQKFNHIPTGLEINIFAGHLKSGEGPAEEAVRVSTLRPFIDQMKLLSNPICLLDMNSSSHYRKGIEDDTVAKAVSEFGFKNVVTQDDVPFNQSNQYQCFKMRGADGNQPPKFLEFMFDTIDGILVEKDTSATFVPVSGAALYNTLYKHRMFVFRTNPKIRQLISNWGLNWHNEFADDPEETYKEPETNGNMEIRPSLQTLTTGNIIYKKGNILKLMSSNESSRWGGDVTTNVYDGMSNYIRFYVPSFDATDDDLKKIFYELYPNELMPSDHPPIAAKIQLKAKPSV